MTVSAVIISDNLIRSQASQQRGAIFILKIMKEVDKMYGPTYGGAAELLRVTFTPDYLTYVGWILAKKHYGIMKKQKSRR